MPCNALCMVCNQLFESLNASCINTFWNDKRTSGKPICENCIDMRLMHTGHINYDIPKNKPKNLMRWIK